jgi:hypothetical protein
MHGDYRPYLKFRHKNIIFLKFTIKRKFRSQCSNNIKEFNLRN